MFQVKFIVSSLAFPLAQVLDTLAYEEENTGYCTRSCANGTALFMFLLEHHWIQGSVLADNDPGFSVSEN